MACSKRLTYFSPSASLLLDYKGSLLLVFGAMVAAFVLLPILGSVEQLYYYHFKQQTGFIPGLSVSLPVGVQSQDLGSLQQEMQAQFGVANVLTGKQLHVAGARFANDGSESIEQDITVIGLSFEGDRSLGLLQGGGEYSCELKTLEQFGSWILGVEGCPELVDGPARIVEEGVTLPVQVYVEAGQAQLYFSAEEDPLLDEGFYQFVEKLVNRFFDLDHSGMQFDRFVDLSDRRGLDFDIYKKRSILAYSQLVFGGGYDFSIPALVSSQLLKENSSYEIATDSTLQVQNLEVPLTILDGFSFSAERHYSNSVVLMPLDSFEEYFGNAAAVPVLNIYSDDLQGLVGAKRHIEENLRGAMGVLKAEAVPSFEAQQSAIEGARSALFFILFFILFLVMFLNLQKFYSIFEGQLFLLKVYGYSRPVFSQVLIVLGVLASGTSYGLLSLFYALNNDVLRTYFYPEIKMPESDFVLLVVVGLAIVIPIAAIERYYNLRKVIQ